MQNGDGDLRDKLIVARIIQNVTALCEVSLFTKAIYRILP
jgi:hypothetical protein